MKSRPPVLVVLQQNPDTKTSEYLHIANTGERTWHTDPLHATHFNDWEAAAWELGVKDRNIQSIIKLDAAVFI